MEEKKIISGLDVLKFVMAIFIVNIHLKPLRYASETVQDVVGIMAGLAVPVFFTVSSFLLFRKIQGGGNSGDIRKIAHFCKRLVTLYLFWCVVWSPVVYMQKDYFHPLSPFAPLLLVRDFLFGSIFDASWFLGALLIGVPVVYVLTRVLRTAFFWIIPLGLYVFICLGGYYPVTWQLVNGWYEAYVCEDGMWLSFPSGLVWISLGYMLSRDKVVDVFSRWRSSCLWLLSVLSVVFLEVGVSLPVVGNIITVALLFTASYTVKLPRRPDLYKRLRTYSILFYVIHDCFKKIPKQLFGMENGPALFFVTIMFCLLASEAIIRLRQVKGFGWLKYAY